MYKDIKPGKYTAVAVQGQFTKSKEKGTPCVAVLFEFKCNGETEKLWWTGWLSPAAIERTIETLANVGYLEDKGHLQDGSIPESHFAKTEVQIVIDEEKYTNQNGEEKSSMKIKYVNKINNGFDVDPNDVKAMMSGIDIKAQMKAARAKLGLKVQAPKNEPPKFDTEESVPF